MIFSRFGQSSGGKLDLAPAFARKIKSWHQIVI
jgi:hypothetical protein